MNKKSLIACLLTTFLLGSVAGMRLIGGPHAIHENPLWLIYYGGWVGLAAWFLLSAEFYRAQRNLPSVSGLYGQRLYGESWAALRWFDSFIPFGIDES